MLLLHVVIALASVLLSTYLIVRPNKRGIWVSGTLIAATTLSGVYLMVMNPAYVVRGCIAYVAYTIFVTALTAKASHTLARQEI